MIIELGKKKPTIDESCFVAETAVIAGDVAMGKDSSAWFGAVIRGDMAKIEIGEKSNIQDNAVVHVGLNAPVKIGNNVTVGHGAIIHGCTIGDNVLVGMGAIVMDGAVIGKNAVIGAGAVVTESTEIPEGKTALGCPAKVVKDVGEKRIMMNRINAVAYVQEAKKYKK